MIVDVSLLSDIRNIHFMTLNPLQKIVTSQNWQSSNVYLSANNFHCQYGFRIFFFLFRNMTFFLFLKRTLDKYLKEINFRKNLFSRGSFFQESFNFSRIYFRENENCKCSGGLNFARSGLFSKIQNLKTKRLSRRPIKNFETVEILSKKQKLQSSFQT